MPGMTRAVEPATEMDAKELIILCRTGRLHDVEKWIHDGRSLDVSAATKRGCRRYLLEIAVETGFHSMVELIAKHDASESSKVAALAQAVASRRLDLVELLLAHGADIKSVSLIDVLLDWEPKMIRFFLDQGADPIEGRPFAVAFGARIRTALRAFLECKEEHPELASQLREQLDCALRHFCAEGDLKWVSLLMWAGGDPRSRGPVLEKDYTEDPECYSSGLDEACGSENPEVLKRLKPDPSRDNLSLLLRETAMWGHKATLEYLLEFGTDPNDKANGGSSALDSALWNLSFGRFNPYGNGGLKSRYEVSNALDCVGMLLAHGAMWNPDDDTYRVSSLRRTLIDCEPSVTIELLQLFRKHNACPAERVHKLLGTPRMKAHMKPVTSGLLRLGIDLEKKPKARRATGRP
jgi:ankyrin repeat protein